MLEISKLIFMSLDSVWQLQIYFGDKSDMMKGIQVHTCITQLIKKSYVFFFLPSHSSAFVWIIRQAREIQWWGQGKNDKRPKLKTMSTKCNKQIEDERGHCKLVFIET